MKSKTVGSGRNVDSVNGDSTSNNKEAPVTGKDLCSNREEISATVMDPFILTSMVSEYLFYLVAHVRPYHYAKNKPQKYPVGREVYRCESYFILE